MFLVFCNVNVNNIFTFRNWLLYYEGYSVRITFMLAMVLIIRHCREKQGKRLRWPQLESVPSQILLRTRGNVAASDCLETILETSTTFTSSCLETILNHNLLLKYLQWNEPHVSTVFFFPPRYITCHEVGGKDYVSSFDGGRRWGSFSLSRKFASDYKGKYTFL